MTARSNSDQCRMSYSRSASGRTDWVMSWGSTATPTGTGHSSARRADSRCSRADEAAVAVSQYSETSVRIRSSLTGVRRSVHCANRSAIHARWPTGESVSA
ncbi:hypothetical protein ABZX68_00705 [Streptomyces cellulosae]